MTHIDLRECSVSEDDLAEMLLGPTGNLRAPTVRAQRTLVVGFNHDAYQALHKGEKLPAKTSG